MVSPEPQGAPATGVGNDPLIGTLIAGKYRVQSLFARGGMGRIYRAVQEPLGRVVALKVLTPAYAAQEPEMVARRFLREAATCASLRHPNTVTVFDYGALSLGGQDTLFIVMEFVEGRTLFQALREDGAFPAPRAARIAREICRSLREAHAAGVVHRDLKPSNVILLDRDDGESVKVLDFGVAKVLQEGADAVTQDGSFVGSPRYCSPEQIQAEEVDGRADIYALGVVMYEMLSGATPFGGREPLRLLMAHLHEAVPPLGPRCATPPPPGFERLVMACLEKDRARRPDSVDAVLAALPFADATLAPGEVQIPASPRKQRGGLLLGAGAGLGLAALLCTGLAAVAIRVATRPDAPAVRVPDAAPVVVPEAAPVIVKVTPAGAEVREGGRLLGVAPLSLPPGAPRQLDVTLPGYTPTVIRWDGASPIEVELAPVPVLAKPKPRPRETADDDIRTER